MGRVIEVDELKKIASSICKEENISYGRNYIINAVTPKEFYRDYLLKKPYKLMQGFFNYIESVFPIAFIFSA